MANIQITSTTSSSISCQVVNLGQYYPRIEWLLLIQGQGGIVQSSGIINDPLLGNQFTFTGLSSNITYVVGCRLYLDATSDYCDTAISDPVTLSGSSSSTYAITIRVNNDNYGEALAFESWAAPGTQVNIDAMAYPGYSFAAWSSDPSVSFGNPFSASTYFIMPDSDVTITANFIAAQARPNTFSWTNGTYNPLTKCYEKVKGSQFDLTALEWQGLYDNINKVRVYRNLAEYDFYGTDPKVSSGDTFYYYLYNRAVFAIQTIDSSGVYCQKLSFVDPNTPVMAEQLNNLMYAINEIQ